VILRFVVDVEWDDCEIRLTKLLVKCVVVQEAAILDLRLERYSGVLYIGDRSWIGIPLDRAQSFH